MKDYRRKMLEELEKRLMELPEPTKEEIEKQNRMFRQKWFLRLLKFKEGA